ncbi:AAA domain [Actinobacteria bacterium IMCC26256]|nr:AAA domain [Actinobacteria bacterium IMCC26256]
MTAFKATTAADLLNTPTANLHIGAAPVATGLAPLDDALHGGLRIGDLSVLAGRPGIGKTVTALQIARNAALDGRAVTFVCSEHSNSALLERLLVLEARSIAREDESHLIDSAIHEVIDSARGGSRHGSLSPLGEEVLSRVSQYGSRFVITGIDSSNFSFHQLEALSPPAEGLLIVDRLDARSSSQDGIESITTADFASALKSIATRLGISVLATCGTNQGGMDARRLAISGIKDAASLDPFCDLILILNEKARAVADVAIAFNPAKSDEFSRQVLITVEKNRAGRGSVNIEFDKDFEFYRLNPQGSFLIEKLLSDVRSEG